MGSTFLKALSALQVVSSALLLIGGTQSVWFSVLQRSVVPYAHKCLPKGYFMCVHFISQMVEEDFRVITASQKGYSSRLSRRL